MNLVQALVYFLKEAIVSLSLSWRGSTLAVLTCALSLYIGSFFFLVSGNLSRQTEEWQSSMMVSVYLAPDHAAADVDRIASALSEPEWTSDAVLVPATQAQERFRKAFPQVAEALGDATPMDLPASVEAAVTAGEVDQAEWGEWIATLRALEGVSSVDDDRDWIRDVQNFSVWVRGAGIALSLALLVAAAFTIATVVRLTAYQYLDEISVLRMVGATEFYVRGPFVVEGFLQGLFGGALAIIGLWLTHFLAAVQSGDSFWIAVLFDRFLSPSSQASIVAVGAIAGLIGSTLSIRRESLVEVAD